MGNRRDLLGSTVGFKATHGQPATRPMDLDSDEGEGNDMAGISMAIVMGVSAGISALGAAKARTQQREQFDTAQASLDEGERFNRLMRKQQSDRLMPYSRWGLEQAENIRNAVARKGDIRTTPIEVPEEAFDTSTYTSGPLFDGLPPRADRRTAPSTRSWQEPPPETLEVSETEFVGNLPVRSGRPMPTGQPLPRGVPRPELEPYLDDDPYVNRHRHRGTIGDLV